MSLSDDDLRRLQCLPDAVVIGGFSPTQRDYAALVAAILDHPFVETAIGTDSGSLPVYRMDYGDVSKPTFWVDACIHGSEWIATEMLMEFTRRWAVDQSAPFAWLRANMRCTALPCVCPWGFDGVHYTNNNGVNLNRNFDNNWAAYPNNAPPDPNYKGSAAFSEPESQIARDQFNLVKPLLAVNVHTSTGGGGMEPGGGTPGVLGYRQYSPLLKPVENSLGYLCRDMSQMTYATTTSPTASAWYGAQASGYGYPTIASILEMASDDPTIGATYGMTALYAMARQAHEYFSYQALNA